MMRKFNKALRQTTRDNATLFQIQINSSVTTSQCLLFDRIVLENQNKSSKEKSNIKEKSYTVGLYRNDYPDSFLVFYKDSSGKVPKDIVWLKDCTVTGGHYFSSNVVTLVCNGVKYVLKFENNQAKDVWYKCIQDEITFLDIARNRSVSQCSSSGSAASSEELGFTLDKHTVLRRSRGRKSANLEEMFIQDNDNQR